MIRYNFDEHKIEYLFYRGFTYKSYFNIVKGFTEGLYKNAINAGYNKNEEFTTKGLRYQYLSDKSINACAYIKNNYDNVEINTGTVAEIFGFFHTAFADRSVFPEIGKANIEANIMVKVKVDVFKKRILFDGKPQDADRETISNIVSIMALRYICFHELGHLLNGHLYYLDNKYSIKYNNMISKKCISIAHHRIPEYALDSRTLEMDADSLAATQGIVNIIGLFQSYNEQQFFFRSLKEPLQIFELWIFAIHSMFLLFEKENPSYYGTFKEYLPNQAREIMNVQAAENTIDDMIEKGYFSCTANERKQIQTYFSSGIIKAEEYFNKKYEKSFDYMGHGKTSPFFREYADETLNHWDKVLLRELKPYSRTILYNPDGMDY